MIGCRNSDESLWDEILDADNDKMKTVLQNPDKYELQIIYTEINNTGKEVILTRHTFRLDTNTYFYPASTVKMPVAFLALEKLKAIKTKNPDIGIFTPIIFDSIRPSQSAMTSDSCSLNGFPTIASLIDQVFAISDNNAYNRLFEFTGQRYINQKLYDKKLLTNGRILTRVGVSGYDSLENTFCNPIHFRDSINEDLLFISGKQSVYTGFPDIPNGMKGKGYYDDATSKVIMEPFDMSGKNFINLAEMDRILKRIILPDLYAEDEIFDIDEPDYAYLMESMEKLPKDFECYADDVDHYYDGYVKFFMFGDHKENIPDHITIKNKVGLAYGYITDVAYIEDTQNNIEFFLAATLLVNENQIFNDGKYEYDEIGIPFLAELGRKVYQYELNKKSSN